MMGGWNCGHSQDLAALFKFIFGRVKIGHPPLVIGFVWKEGTPFHWLIIIFSLVKWPPLWGKSQFLRSQIPIQVFALKNCYHGCGSWFNHGSNGDPRAKEFQGRQQQKWTVSTWSKWDQCEVNCQIWQYAGYIPIINFLYIILFCGNYFSKPVGRLARTCWW